jgi:hypothetical protein
VLVVADTVKPTSAGAVASCKALGVRRVLLTGDNPATARGRRGGRHRRRDYRGPAVRQGRRHQAPPGRGSGRGDGRRRRQRRPALAQADLALAIGAGTDVAIEASDLTVVSGDLRAAADAIRLSRTTLRTIKQNSPGRSATSSPHCRWPPPACSTQSSPARRWRSPARQSSPTHCACGASAPRNGLGKLSGCGPRRARRPGRSGGHPHARGDRLVTTPPSLVHGTSDQPRAPGSQHRARRRSSRSSTGPVGRKSRDEAHRTAGRMTSQSSAEYFRLVNQPTRDGWAALGVLGARALMMLATPTQMSSRTSERLSTALMRRSRRETPGRRR